MKTLLRGTFAALMLCASAVAGRTEGLQTIDQGRFIVFQGDVPVALERFEYVRSGDSLVITAVVQRKAKDSSGVEVRFDKTAQMVVTEADYGIHSYLSNQSYDGHTVTKHVTPGDTLLTVATEVDGAGDLVGVTRPPGRLFVMDPLVFSLFDIICRSVSPQTFSKRPIQLLTLGPSSTTTEATIATAGADTVRWGGKRVIARRFVMTDSGSRFTVWMDPKGHMLRLEHDGSGVSVVREEPTPDAKPARKKSVNAK